MAQRIQVLCDLHLEKDEEVAAAPVTFGLGQAGAKPTTYEADLCEVCTKELVELLGRFSDLGRKVSGPRRSPGTAARQTASAAGTAVAAPAGLSEEEAAKQRALNTGGCPLCDYMAAGQSKTALRRHLREVHETTLDAAVGLPTPFQCPDCGEAFGRSQGLGLHRKRIHGAASVG